MARKNGLRMVEAPGLRVRREGGPRGASLAPRSLFLECLERLAGRAGDVGEVRARQPCIRARAAGSSSSV